MAPRQINIEIYSKDFAPSTHISAKEAKELFFLTPAELSYVHYEQEKGWGGSCKLFNIHEIKRIAIRKLGSLQALIQKAEAMNTRRTNKKIRDYAKQLEEEQRRKDAIATAERLRVAEVERKKQVRLEKKRHAEQQAQDAASWRTLVEGIEEFNGMQIVSAEALRRMLEDVQVWKKRKEANDHDDVDIQMPMPMAPLRTTISSSGLPTADDTTTKTMTTEQQQNRKSMGDLYRRCCDVDFSDDSNSSSEEEENDVTKKDRRGKGRGGGKPGVAEISPPKKRKVVEGELHHATATVTVTPK